MELQRVMLHERKRSISAVAVLIEEILPELEQISTTPPDLIKYFRSEATYLNAICCQDDPMREGLAL